MQDTATTMARLVELSLLGVRLAVDDFGTGYSSLSYLRRFPVHVLKIAKPFTDDAVAGPQRSALLRGMVDLGRALSLDVVAEGVEEAGQVVKLRELGCPLGQGYLFSGPLDAAALERFLSGSRGNAAVPAAAW